MKLISIILCGFIASPEYVFNLLLVYLSESDLLFTFYGIIFFHVDEISRNTNINFYCNISTIDKLEIS